LIDPHSHPFPLLHLSFSSTQRLNISIILRIDTNSFSVARFGALNQLILGVDTIIFSELAEEQMEEQMNGMSPDTEVAPSFPVVAPNLPVVALPMLNLTIFTALEISRSQYGYSYSMVGLARRLSTGILLTHALIVLIHTTLVVWYKWRCDGLQSLTDLFVLTVDSSRTLSQGTSLSEKGKDKCTIKVKHLTDDQLGLEIDG
jgi:hypothetical protein